jgi:hypothetical protein
VAAIMPYPGCGDLPEAQQSTLANVTKQLQNRRLLKLVSST